MSVTGFDVYFSVLLRVQSVGFTPNSISHNLVLVIYNFFFAFIIKDEIKKEFYGTTLPARLEKFEALLKSRDEGKGFFLGEKVR